MHKPLPAFTALSSALLATLLTACQPAPPATDAVAGDADAAPAAATDAPHHFQCGELALDVTFDDGGERATLSYSGRRLELPIVVSASGARYADATGNEFWTKGEDTAMLTLAGQEQRNCTPGTTPSPWSEAAARGIVFRAIGQEPGWLVEVGPGEAPPLSAQLDYGERSVEVAQATPLLAGEASGYEGETADGTRVVLEVERGECADSMSGEQFEARVRLLVNEQTYEGCGAFLPE